MKDFLRRLWAKPIFRHIISSAVAVFISTTAQKNGVDPVTAQQAGQAVGEVVNTIPAE